MTGLVFRPDIVEASDLRAQGDHTTQACPAMHPDRWLCTRVALHSGQHAAGTSGKWFAALWDQDPLDVECPACQSRPGALCTLPDDNGRHPVKTFHHAREDRARGESEG